MRRLCTICARGGSQGLPGKNLRPLLGRPLLGHSIEHARASGLFDVVAVSSDSAEIRRAGEELGADLVVVRPEELATSTAPRALATAHCLEEAERQLSVQFDTVVELPPTSPLRTAADVIGAVEKLEGSQGSNVITGSPARRNPYYNMVETRDDGTVRLVKPPAEPFTSRDQAPECFDMNDAVFAWRAAVLRHAPSVLYEDTLLYVMPQERSVDIDALDDFEYAEYLLRRRGG